MKKTFRTLGALTIAAALTAGFTACSNDDITAEQATVQPAAKTYTVSIPASFGSSSTRAVTIGETTTTHTFESGEKVYVYNVTKNEVLSGYLQPTNISEDGKNCDLAGTLTGTLSKGDELTLLYNPNSEKTNEKIMDYSLQTGAATNIPDGAVATATLSSIEGSVLTTTEPVAFQNAQSLFRQRLTFKNANNETVQPTITSLRIRSKNNKLVRYYRPVSNEYAETIDGGGIVIQNPTIDANGDIYLALRFTGSSSTDALILTAYDSEGNIYELEKNAPSTGFQNGRYYYGSMTLPYVRNLNSFMVTGTTATPNSSGTYFISQDNFDITVSGTTGDRYFTLQTDGKMTLNDVTATVEYTFISGYNGKTITLEINGTNTISCNQATTCIAVSNLKLCGAGTLTVSTNNRQDLCGIFVNNGAANPGTIAAEGYTVTRTEVSSTAPYTWTYTVAPTTTNP